MKFWFNAVVIFLFAALAAGYCAIVDRAAARKEETPLDAEALLDAIAQVESSGNPTKIGPHGERGRCQFKEATWRRYTTASWQLWAPVDCDLTHKVERAHLARLCRELRAEMLSPDPCFLAAAWHHGAAGAARHARDDDAQRIANLYFDAIERQQGGEP